MSALIDKRILLGISGGIAAYKSAELVRHLRAAGADVRVVMTDAAAEFITPLTLQALSGHAVRRRLVDAGAEAAMGHIELARWADAILVAPASADLMARLAAGRADDLLAAVCLATERPLALAPAMNQAMWAHPATQANRETLSARGTHLWGPAEGEQACGEVGPGRLLEPPVLVERLAALFETGVLAGRTVLVTAGPTREPLDPVRFISNRSSGRMGFALAAAAAEAGARVILVAGPSALAAPRGVRRIDVERASEMHEAVTANVADCDIFIGAAAVADYRPKVFDTAKAAKSARGMQLELMPTEDVAAAVAARSPPPFTVGLAAETHDLLARADAKRRRKGLDMIAANEVGRPGQGFESEENAFEVLWDGGQASLARTHKARLARQLIRLIAERYDAQRQAQDPRSARG